MVLTDSDIEQVSKYLCKWYGEDISQEAIYRVLCKIKRGWQPKSLPDLKRYVNRVAVNLIPSQQSQKIFYGVDPENMWEHPQDRKWRYKHHILEGIEEFPIKHVASVEGHMRLAKLSNHSEFNKVVQYLSGDRKFSRQRLGQIRQELRRVI